MKRKADEIADLARVQRSTVYNILKRLNIPTDPHGYDEETTITVLAETAKRRRKPAVDDTEVKNLKAQLKTAQTRADELQQHVTWLQGELDKTGDRLDREQALHLMADKRSDKLMARGLFQRIANTPVEVLEAPEAPKAAKEAEGQKENP